MFLTYCYQETSGLMCCGGMAEWLRGLIQDCVTNICSWTVMLFTFLEKTGHRLGQKFAHSEKSEFLSTAFEQPYLSMVLYHIPTEVQKDTKDDPFYKPVVWWIGVQNPTEVFCGSLMSFRSEQVVLSYWAGSPLMTIPGSEKWKIIIFFITVDSW